MRGDSGGTVGEGRCVRRSFGKPVKETRDQCVSNLHERWSKDEGNGSNVVQGKMKARTYL